MGREKACLDCQKHKKKCVRVPHDAACERCISLGRPMQCSYVTHPHTHQFSPPSNVGSPASFGNSYTPLPQPTVFAMQSPFSHAMDFTFPEPEHPHEPQMVTPALPLAASPAVSVSVSGSGSRLCTTTDSSSCASTCCSRSEQPTASRCCGTAECTCQGPCEGGSGSLLAQLNCSSSATASGIFVPPQSDLTSDLSVSMVLQKLRGTLFHELPVPGILFAFAEPMRIIDTNGEFGAWSGYQRERLLAQQWSLSHLVLHDGCSTLWGGACPTPRRALALTMRLASGSSEKVLGRLMYIRDTTFRPVYGMLFLLPSQPW